MRLSSALALLIVAALAPAARANMADPITPGDRVGEPSEALRGLVVVRERLTFDLRPLAEGGRATIEAEYRVRNDGPVRAVPLAFVPLQIAGDGAGVWLDGRPVAFTRGAGALPPSWLPENDAEPAGEWAEADVLRFAPEIGPGEHTVRVRYHAAPTTDAAAGPTLAHALAYSLAPARQWAGFGRLDVEVLAPPGWSVTAEPALTRDGDRLVGAFEGVPADVLTLTAQGPAPWGIWPLRLGAWAFVLALWGFAGHAFGRWLGRRGAGWAWALPFAFAGALVGAVGIVAATLASYGLAEANGYSYGGAMLAFFAVLPLASVVGFAVVLATALWSRRAAGRQADRLAPSDVAA